ncbi:MAG TPA: kinase [Caulobacter sp.]|nr:kinase [Caulobacter sp.]
MTRAHPALSELLRGLALRPARTGPPLVGVSGAQGSGKTTLVRAVAADIGAACLSLDDVYLPSAERLALAQRVHPLFSTRGPPGSHDLSMLSDTLEALFAARPGDRTPVPAFDKLADDPLPRAAWPVFEGRPTAILIDGWCLGATPQLPETLEEPINSLERDRDPDGLWRKMVNDNLAGPYAMIFSRFDSFLHLAAPDFGVVQGWREQQQAGLLGRDLAETEKAAMKTFVQHFERITRHMLAGGRLPGPVVQLDAQRRPLGPAVESR